MHDVDGADEHALANAAQIVCVDEDEDGGVVAGDDGVAMCLRSPDSRVEKQFSETMDDDFEFAAARYPTYTLLDTIQHLMMGHMNQKDGEDHQQCSSKRVQSRLIVLLIVGGLVLAFLAGNYALYLYAQKTLPPKKKKPISKKKLKRERMKQGVSAPGE
ncbi:hypothetical protein Cgig2_003813 [Carnegiea gigantea]|uniref:Uncharacterized protein n=1 Tax=Carnegiea gigantea TaxID=171969 RepID=A0A9Q1K647_9CARY|nr:hypothetical protein Cgig2_003813 [Carnegiea gigantea]